MSKKIDIVGQKFNHLTVLEDIGGGKVICQCDCKDKIILECYKKNVKSGRHTSCGCASRKKNTGSYVGQQFGNWIILAELGGGKVFCECQCKDKTTRELYKKAVLDGQTKSCGCMAHYLTGKAHFQDITGETFGELKVLERDYERS